MRYRSLVLVLGGVLEWTQLGCDSSSADAPAATEASPARGAASAGVGPGGAGGGGEPARSDSAQAGGASGSPGGESGASGAPSAATGGRDAGMGIEDAAVGTAGAGGSGAVAVEELGKFSFFVTSLSAMRELSGSQDGFGGDLRFGQATGLEGADEICRQTAERSMPGASAKTWRAFLSVTSGGPDGGPVHAIDRVGEGPWYDRLERLVAMSKDDLGQPRPRGADPAIINDLPNENGIPNHLDGAPDCTGNDCPDNHLTLTGSNEVGMLREMDPAFTCNDWTSAASEGSPWCGASWPRGDRGNWMSYAPDSGCAPCVQIVERGPPMAAEACVGSGGGYGGIYCFALTP
jgi:hypothetical protein